MILDFSEVEFMKKMLIVFLNLAVTAAVILTFWFGIGVFRKISKPIKGILGNIERFQNSPFDEEIENNSVETSVKEISQLQESIQEMEKQIRDQMIHLYLTNENLRQDIEKYKFDALLDPLTQLFNRRFLMKCIKDLQNSASNIVVCFLDIDSFKMINDTYGHAVGDMVLKTLSEKLRTGIRKEDLAFRIGGDEFVVLFRDLQIQEAHRIIERIQNKLKHVRFENFPELKISVSYGFSQWSKDSKESIEEALKKADLQMYQKKYEKKEDSYL